MKAMVLAAGFGTRLKPLTLAVPKPMIPVVNKPVMQYNIELLKKFGIKDLYANIHYFPEQLENYFGDGSHHGVKLRYSYEEELLGTAGGVKRMAEELAKVDSTFLVMSSDALTDINPYCNQFPTQIGKVLVTFLAYYHPEQVLNFHQSRLFG